MKAKYLTISLVLVALISSSFYNSGNNKKYWMCCCISHKQNEGKVLNILSALVIEAPNKQLADKAFRLYVKSEDKNSVISKDAYIIWEINDDIIITASDLITVLDRK